MGQSTQKVNGYRLILMSLIYFSGACCNTCQEVRAAYNKKGWGFTNPDIIEQVRYCKTMVTFYNYFQCVREGFSQYLQAEAGEGCQVYGYLLVNKVRTSLSH